MTASEVFISVVIPVRNKAPHIHRSLRSVFAQNYENLEVLVIDDNSTDDSMQEVAKFEDARIRCFHRDQPGPGGYAARNKGISVAKGEWICFLDADDEWTAGYLDRLIATISANPEVEIFSTGWWISGDKRLDPVQDEYSLRNVESASHRFGLKEYMRGPRPMWTGVVTVRNELVKRVGGFDERWRHGADLQLWLKLLIHSAHPACWVGGHGAIYHRDSVNMVTSKLSQSLSPSAVYIRELVEYDGVPCQISTELLKRYANKSALRPFLRSVADGEIDSLDVSSRFFRDELGRAEKIALCGLALAPPAARRWLARKALYR